VESQSKSWPVALGQSTMRGSSASHALTLEQLSLKSVRKVPACSAVK